jgi:hypothetical protein
MRFARERGRTRRCLLSHGRRPSLLVKSTYSAARGRLVARSSSSESIGADAVTPLEDLDLDEIPERRLAPLGVRRARRCDVATAGANLAPDQGRAYRIRGSRAAGHARADAALVAVAPGLSSRVARAAVVARTEVPSAGPDLLSELPSDRGRFQPYHAMRGDLLARIGKSEEGAAATRRPSPSLPTRRPGISSGAAWSDFICDYADPTAHPPIRSQRPRDARPVA